MNKMFLMVVGCLLFASQTFAEPALSEDVVKGISAELKQAVYDGDISVFEKYIYPGTEIVIDMDPSLSAGEVEIKYADYMQLLGMSLPLMQDAELHDEILSLSIDEKKNQATIREKTTSVVAMMGIKMRDVSISETTYGVVKGQIKALRSTEQLISSEQIN